MKNKTDTWVEMSIVEIQIQCRFAEIAYSHIRSKARRDNDLVFSSIHSFLSHCVMISKMLRACNDGVPPSFLTSVFNMFKKHKHVDCTTIGKILNVSPTSLVHKRKFRNHLEHYDERLKKWIEKYPSNINIGLNNIGSKSAIVGNIVFIRHYDPTTNNFTFVDKDFNLNNLKREISKIKIKADEWVNKVRIQSIKPPFII